MKNIVASLFLMIGFCCGVHAEEQAGAEQEKELFPSYMASMEQVDDESGCEADEEESTHFVA